MKEDPERKFILAMHVFPGLNYFQGLEQFWHSEPTKVFNDLMQKYRNQILIGTGAHVHQAEFRAPIYGDKSESVPYLVSASISPVYMNNPTFTTIEI